MLKSKYFIISSIFSFLALGALAQSKITEPVQILPNHTQDVSAVVFGPPSSKILVSGGWDNSINIYNSDSPFVHLKTLQGHASAVKTIAFNPNGKQFASGGNDHTIIIWDSLQNKAFVIDDPIKGHDTKINTLIYNRTGKYILSGADDGKIIVWDSKTGKFIKSLSNTTSVNALTSTINPLYIIVAGAEPTIKMMNVANGKIFKTFDGHKDAVNCVAMSPNNKYLLSGSNDKSAKLWDSRTFKEVRTFAVDCWKVTAVAFTIDSRFCATACNDGSIKIWEVESGNLITEIEAQGFNIRDISFSFDGKYLAAAPLLRADDGTFGVRVYETKLPAPAPLKRAIRNNAPTKKLPPRK